MVIEENQRRVSCIPPDTQDQTNFLTIEKKKFRKLSKVSKQKEKLEENKVNKRKSVINSHSRKR